MGALMCKLYRYNSKLLFAQGRYSSAQAKVASTQVTETSARAGIISTQIVNLSKQASTLSTQVKRLSAQVGHQSYPYEFKLHLCNIPA